MTKFLYWRKMTWALALWSVVSATWLVVGGTGAALVGAMWLLGSAVLGLLWLMTQPLFRQGHGFGNGFVVRPRPGHWGLLNLHRVPVKAHRARRP
jgi:hypothetical protein